MNVWIWLGDNHRFIIASATVSTACDSDGDAKARRLRREPFFFFLASSGIFAIVFSSTEGTPNEDETLIESARERCLSARREGLGWATED